MYRHAFGYNAEETSRISRSEHLTNQRIAFGFNSDEQNRVVRSNEYSTIQRTPFLSTRRVELEPGNLQKVSFLYSHRKLAPIMLYLLPLRILERHSDRTLKPRT